ncbi:MAG: lipid-A-disaccharide synthase [Candidatus Edwardsbacteria bacterium]|nr:lipid-A-disaccharide synthase [Candidatus Edwardsbacteria bacterium]
MTRIMIIAGETSGDLHGGMLVRELRKLDPGLEIYGIGGESMQAAGMELVYHIREFSFMGFVEVLAHLPFIRSVFKRLEELLVSRQPDLLVLIDYPGFNLRFAKIARKAGIEVVYYISPQVWAWGRRRVRLIRRLVKKMLVILPFEEKFYQRLKVPAKYVGNPLRDTVKPSLGKEEFCRQYGLNPQNPLIGLLPGSRRQEVEKILPAMLQACQLLHDDDQNIQFGLGVAPHIDRQYIKEQLDRCNINVALVENQAYDLMVHSRLVLVASGTATLETGLAGTPMIIIYRTNPLSFIIGKLLVKLPFIGLVNLVAGRKVVPEFLQWEARPGAIFLMAKMLLEDGPPRQAVINELARIPQLLGEPGAARRAAEEILECLTGSKG